MFQHILFATDGSLGAARAADYAASLAIRFHAKVTVLHAFHRLTSPPPGYRFPNVEAGATQQDAQDLVQHTAEKLRNHGISTVEVEVIQGQPVHVILGVAESLAPNVIVMGARGVSTWQGAYLGSTSLSVVQRALAAVLVVR